MNSMSSTISQYNNLDIIMIMIIYITKQPNFFIFSHHIKSNFAFHFSLLYQKKNKQAHIEALWWKFTSCVFFFNKWGFLMTIFKKYVLDLRNIVTWWTSSSIHTCAHIPNKLHLNLIQLFNEAKRGELPRS